MSSANEELDKIEDVNSLEEATSKLTVEKSKSVEEIAADLTKQALLKSNENLIVSNFVKFFEPVIQNLDSNVESLRLSQCKLTNQIKTLLNQISIIYEEDKKKLDLDDYAKRLTQAKKRLNIVQATIISVQERLNRIYIQIQKDQHLKQYKQQQQQQQQAS